MTSQTPGTGQAQSCAECGTRGEPGQSFCDACGAVLGWSGTPARATTGGTGSEPTDRAGAGHPTADTPAPANAGRTTADDERGWDAFAHPGAGTGTARTGHDPAQAGATATATTGVRAPQTGPAARADAPTAPTAPGWAKASQ
ncbi:zinc ribbon domain-containing protein, partial [Streptomyces europaeiscabiei]|nr:zinc ribbon domain-containing protein [Streptomyces europaeiscabiei]